MLEWTVKMIWNDLKIHVWAASGGVTPFDESCVNPASLDLRLGNTIRAPRFAWSRKELYSTHSSINRDTAPEVLWEEPVGFSGWRLNPGAFVLCHSLEYTIIPDDAIATLYSKSSTGRLGLEHLHAGYGDCGFSGQWTFEFHNVAPWPIELVAGERIMQLVLMDMVAAPSRTYKETGRYNGQLGPTPAKN